MRVRLSAETQLLLLLLLERLLELLVVLGEDGRLEAGLRVLRGGDGAERGD